MPFAAALSQHPLATHAVGEVVGQVLDSLGDRPDAAVVFVTPPFAGAMEDIAAAIRATLRPGALIGATAASVLAGEREVEHGAAISLFAMRFGGPGSRSSGAAAPHAVAFDAHREDEGWRVTATDGGVPDGATVVLLADPFSFPVESFVADVTARSPGTQVVGGLASAAANAGGNRLVADGLVVDHGAVALVLPRGIGATALVSQGCRPVGVPLVVTDATGNLITEIAGQPALDRVMAQAEAATPEDRNGMARSLQVGLVVDERKVDFGPGDFLIRPVLGADKQRRAVAVGTEVAVGSTVQFHVRDARAADEDLRDLLAAEAGQAALVFTCTGRGTALFGEPHHDATTIAGHVEGGAVAGMFCAGEIGPVGDDRSIHAVHAMSASVLLLDDGS